MNRSVSGLGSEPPRTLLPFALVPLGLAILVTAAYIGTIGENLLVHVPAFVTAFLVAFGLYLLAVGLVLRSPDLPHSVLGWIFVVSAVAMAILVFTNPRLSDDMYRYVWDGHVQAVGISPYRYPPEAPELAFLRDGHIYYFINRKAVVTIYPPVAEFFFWALWRVAGNQVHAFQAAMAAAALLGGVLLLGLLKDLGLSPNRALVYLWSPLLAYETAHSAHVDSLALPFLVGAWWARVRERDEWVGVLLGLATAVKLYPALLFPALWRPNHPRGRWRMPLAFGLTLVACYLPYLVQSGAGVFGYLFRYFNETFNVSPVLAAILPWLSLPGLLQGKEVVVLSLGVLALISLWMVFHPAPSATAALRRGIWLMGPVALFSQNFYSWYLLWMLPLIAVFLEPRPGPKPFPYLRVDAWTAWFLFTGLVGLSYTFFIDFKPVPVALWIEYLPLYLLLGIDLIASLRFTSLPGKLLRLPRQINEKGSLDG